MQINRDSLRTVASEKMALLVVGLTRTDAKCPKPAPTPSSEALDKTPGGFGHAEFSARGMHARTLRHPAGGPGPGATGGLGVVLSQSLLSHKQEPGMMPTGRRHHSGLLSGKPDGGCDRCPGAPVTTAASPLGKTAPRTLGTAPTPPQPDPIPRLLLGHPFGSILGMAHL